MSTVRACELSQQDLPFLLQLWRIPEVMRHADEFPRLRGWTKQEEPDIAWRRYLENRERLGPSYTQFIVRLGAQSGTPIGEAVILPLPEGYSFGKWQKPAGILTVMGDVKLLPGYWGRGLGTAAMQQVAAGVFGQTAVDLFIVPPHRRNPGAERVYEKVGFRLAPDTRSYRGHRVMTLSRTRFAELHTDLNA